MRLNYFAIVLMATFPSLVFAQVGESSSDRPGRHHKHHYVRHNRISRHYHGGGGWGAIAVSLEDGGVSSGYAVRRRSPAAAIADAVSVCSQTGRSGCYPPIAAFQGCAYVAVTVDGSSESRWATNSTPQGALDLCQSNGDACQTPIGGCN